MTKTMQIQPRRDSDIEQWVLRRLQQDQGLASKELCVFCCDGVVTLKGSVPSYRSKMIAQSAAVPMDGVLAVVNEIVVEPNRNRAKVKRTRPKVMAMAAAESSLRLLHG